MVVLLKDYPKRKVNDTIYEDVYLYYRVFFTSSSSKNIIQLLQNILTHRPIIGWQYNFLKLIIVWKITKALGIVTRIYITKLSMNEIRNYREHRRMEKDEIEEKTLIIT